MSAIRGKRGLSCADILRTRGEGVFRCGRLHFLAKKTSDFSKFMVCPHGQRGLSHCGQGGRGSQFFTILCGRLLWTAPKKIGFIREMTSNETRFSASYIEKVKIASNLAQNLHVKNPIFLFSNKFLLVKDSKPNVWTRSKAPIINKLTSINAIHIEKCIVMRTILYL